MKTFCLWLAVLSLSANAFATEIKLNSGKVVSGDIVAVEKDHLKIDQGTEVIVVPFRMIDLSSDLAIEPFQAYREEKLKFKFLQEGPPIPPFYIEKVSKVPNVQQKSNLPNSGEKYCAPTSVANSLMWLDQNGYDRLVNNTDDETVDVLTLAGLLGSKKYMKTDDGTRISDTMAGVEKYVTQKGYSVKYLKYQGFRRIGYKYSTGVKAIDLNWIKRGVVNPNGAVWLEIGWYVYDPKKNIYNRRGSHLINLVGYGKDSSGNPDPRYLIVNDPGAKRWVRNMNGYVRLEPIKSGQLSWKGARYKRNAEGYYKFPEGFLLQHSKSDTAILEGAVVFELNSPEVFEVKCDSAVVNCEKSQQ